MRVPGSWLFYDTGGMHEGGYLAPTIPLLQVSPITMMWWKTTLSHDESRNSPCFSEWLFSKFSSTCSSLSANPEPSSEIGAIECTMWLDELRHIKDKDSSHTRMILYCRKKASQFLIMLVIILCLIITHGCHHQKQKIQKKS